ncbi:MAG: hypothetical protein ACKOV8_11965, partial [Phycisphaerales bacterium]
VQMRDLVREFADQGHHPTVIVPAAGLDRPWKLEHAGGITTLRVRTSPTKDVSYVHRAGDAQRRIGVRDDGDALGPRLVHQGPLRHTTRFT